MFERKFFFYFFRDTIYKKYIRATLIMNTLIIIGAGGHSRVIADTAIAAGWSSLAFYDDHYPSIRSAGPWEIRGTFQDLLLSSPNEPLVIAIGDNTARMQKANALQQAGFRFATIIHPRAIISPSAKIGEGTVIFAGAVVNAYATIEDHCIINTNATIEHDCHLATGVHVSPNAALGGGTKIGKLSWVGIGASIKNAMTIGESTIIGAGAAVIKNIPSHCTAVGVPAHVIEQR